MILDSVFGQSVSPKDGHSFLKDTKVESVKINFMIKIKLDNLKGRQDIKGEDFDMMSC